MIKKILVFSIVFTSFVYRVSAEPEIGNPTSNQLRNPFKGPDSLASLLEVIVNDILLPIGALLAVVAFIFTGFKFVAAQGKPADLEKARKMLLYTSVGTAILLGAWVLAKVICTTVGQLGGPICPIK